MPAPIEFPIRTRTPFPEAFDRGGGGVRDPSAGWCQEWHQHDGSAANWSRWVAIKQQRGSYWGADDLGRRPTPFTARLRYRRRCYSRPQPMCRYYKCSGFKSNRDFKYHISYPRFISTVLRAIGMCNIAILAQMSRLCLRIL